jgi:predicted nucleic acid-binding protein
MTGFVLDSFAVLAWLKNAQPSSSTVQKILSGAKPVSMSAINIGEVVYILHKHFLPAHADAFLQILPNAPFEIVTPNLEDTLEAAALKARYPISYADAIAAQLALKRRHPLVTGDPEFKVIPHLDLLWLPADSA